MSVNGVALACRSLKYIGVSNHGAVMTHHLGRQASRFLGPTWQRIKEMDGVNISTRTKRPRVTALQTAGQLGHG